MNVISIYREIWDGSYNRGGGSPDEKETIIPIPKDAEPVKVTIGIDKRILHQTLIEGAETTEERNGSIYRIATWFLVGFVLGVLSAYLYWISQ